MRIWDTSCLSDWSSDVCSSDLLRHLMSEQKIDAKQAYAVLDSMADYCDSLKSLYLECERRYLRTKAQSADRSEERRVGKERRCATIEKKKTNKILENIVIISAY